MSATSTPQAPAAPRPLRQDGFVLIITLTVMLVCMVIVTALLTLTVDTQHIEDTGRNRERQVRAAEGALDVAINKVRNSQTVAAPLPWQPGLPLNANAAERIGNCDALVPDLLEVDGHPTRVNCTNQGSFPATPPAVGSPDQWIPADNGGPSLRLVGEPYERDFVDQSSLPPAGVLPSGQPATPLRDSPASLLHTGAAPLRVVGGLEARHSVVAVRNPPTATLEGPSADAEPEAYGQGVEVTGYARQGGEGMYTNTTGNQGCGIASPENNWGVQSTTVTADSDPTLVNTDPDDLENPDYVLVNEFVCGDEALAGGAGGALPPGSGDWINADVVATRQTLPANCTALKQNGVVTLGGGAYDAAATAILNNWFTGGCTNTTFYFPPGDYWFDVYSPAAVPDRRTTLNFDDRTSDWVFGAPLLEPGAWPAGGGALPGGRPVPSGFPRVCDPDQQGANITLSARTGWWHNQGRVAICGPRPPVSGNAPAGAPTHTTAIWQRTSVPLGNRLVASTPASASGWSMPGAGPADFAGRLEERDGQLVRTSVNVPTPWEWPWDRFPPWRPTCWDDYVIFGGGGCGPWDRSFSLGDFQLVQEGPTPPEDPGPGPINNAYVDITGNAYYSDRATGSNAAFVRLDVTLSDGQTCSVQTAGLPTNFVTRTYDLFGGGSTCGAVIDDREQLQGADITVSVRMNNPSLGFQDIGQLFFEIDQITLRSGWTPPTVAPTSPGTAGTVGLQPFQNPANAAVDDGAIARVRRNCTAGPPFGWTCVGTEWYESRLDFSFDDPNLLDGFAQLTSAAVVVDMTRHNSMWSSYGPNGTNRLVLSVTAPGGGTCAVNLTRDQLLAALPGPSGTASGTVTLPLVTALDAGNCGSVIRTPAQLIESDFQLLFRASNECGTNQSWIPVYGCDGQFGWDVDAITLQATTLGYPKPQTPFRVRWSPYKTGSSGNPREPGDASFHVVGSTSLTTNDVEVDFDGNGRPTGQPIFVGGSNRPGLVAGSLATRSTTGVWPDWTTHNPFDPDPAQRVDLAPRLPDPISSNGATRPPTRRVLLHSCVIENPEAPVAQQRLVRRATAEVDIRDAVTGGVMVPGHTVTVRRWEHRSGAPVAYGAAASTAACPA